MENCRSAATLSWAGQLEGVVTVVDEVHAVAVLGECKAKGVPSVPCRIVPR
jgi:hypothetical protein